MQRHPATFLCLVSADGLPEVEMEAAAPSGEDIANGKRSRRTSVTGLKEAVEEAEQQAAKRVKAGAGSLEGALPMAPGKLHFVQPLWADSVTQGQKFWHAAGLLWGQVLSAASAWQGSRESSRQPNGWMQGLRF